jgi:hypothetical protein
MEIALNMKNRVASIIGILMLVTVSELLSSCLPGLLDETTDLGGGYTYVRDGKDFKYISYYKINARKDVHPKVTDYAFDASFILVVQEPIKEHGRTKIADLLNSGKENFDDLLRKADSIMVNDPYYIEIYSSKVNYWIIDKVNERQYGPLSKERFEAERKILGVSSQLLFHDVR